MIFGNIKNVKSQEIKSVPYRGAPQPVVGTSVKWLSQVGEPGLPEYGLRYFTIEPGGFLSAHKHQHAQTEIIISGRLLAAHYDDNDRLIEEKEIGPGESFYVGPMEVHGMRNTWSEAATFFCCICVLG